MSETSKYLHLTQPYCKGNGIDIASGGFPVVPNAIQIELPEAEYAHYNSNNPPGSPIQWRGNALEALPFKDGVLDFVYSSHLIEDFSRSRWPDIFREWARCLKPGGYMVVLVPEVKRWNHAVYVLGQAPNCSHHAPEPSVGDMTGAAKAVGLKIIKEHLTECHPNDYSILGVFQKP